HLRVADADGVGDPPAGHLFPVGRPAGHAPQVQAQALGRSPREALSALGWLAVQSCNLLSGEGEGAKGRLSRASGEGAVSVFYRTRSRPADPVFPFALL